MPRSAPRSTPRPAPRPAPPSVHRPVQLSNTKERYGRVAQAFHWTIATLFILNYPLAIVAEKLPRTTGEEVARVVALFSWHKTIGVVVFALAVARIAWALANPHPRLLNAERRVEAFAAATVHWVLYGAILAMPLAGMAIHWTSPGFAPLKLPFPDEIGLLPQTSRASEIAATVHWALGIVILLSIAAHVGGALKHHFIDRDQTLVRMLPTRTPEIGHLPPPSMQPSARATAAVGLGALLLVGGAAGAVAGLRGGDGVVASDAVGAEPADVAAAGGAAWIVDADASALTLSIEQLGSPVEGRFDRWAAAIVHDPARPEASSVTVTVDLDSLTLGTVTDQAKGADFLDVAGASDAVFRAEGFVPAGQPTGQPAGRPAGEGEAGEGEAGDAFTADGTLTLRGATAPVTLAFDLAIEGDAARAVGTTTLPRLDWGVGAAGYPDGSSVGLDVEVGFDLTATRGGAAPDGQTLAAPGS